MFEILSGAILAKLIPGFAEKINKVRKQIADCGEDWNALIGVININPANDRLTAFLYYSQLFYRALYAQNLEVIEALFKQNPIFERLIPTQDANRLPGASTASPLHFIATYTSNVENDPNHPRDQKKDAEIIKFLVKKGASLSIKQNDRIPLLGAIYNKNFSAAMAILELTPAINNQYPDKDGHTALHYLTDQTPTPESITLIAALVKKGADPAIKNSWNITPMENAVRLASTTNNWEAVIAIAKNCRYSPSIFDKAFDRDPKQLGYALYHAVFNNNTAAVKALIEANAPLLDRLRSRTFTEWMDENIWRKADSAVDLYFKKTAHLRRSLLEIAIDHNNPELVSLLIGKGADLSCKNLEGKTPMEYALQKDKLDIAKCISANGLKSDDANIKLKNQSYTTVINKTNTTSNANTKNNQNSTYAETFLRPTLINNVKIGDNSNIVYNRNNAEQTQTTSTLPALTASGLKAN